MPQTTLISIFKYKGAKPKWQAFGRMGRSPLLSSTIKGLTFWKGLGSGNGNGFSMWPDFSTYVLLTVFESEEDAREFINSEVLSQYSNSASKYSHVLAHAIKSHGKWDKQEPFIPSQELDKNKPLAVITRATIKPHKALQFWKHVPSVSNSIDNHQGLIYSKGIGERPLFMQATFSIWKDTASMMSYAYENPIHHEMIKKTREIGWYKEELFARFHPFEVQGNLIPFN